MPCDGLIFDLEDSILEDDRPLAHSNLLKQVKNQDFGQRQTMIRTSATDAASFDGDLKIAIKCNSDAILLPKISSAEQLIHVENKLVKPPNYGP